MKKLIDLNGSVKIKCIQNAKNTTWIKYIGDALYLQLSLQEILTYMTESDAHKRYEFKRQLEELRSKKGRGTELISLYIPQDKQISDVVAQLRDEHGTSPAHPRKVWSCSRVLWMWGVTRPTCRVLLWNLPSP